MTFRSAIFVLIGFLTCTSCTEDFFTKVIDEDISEGEKFLSLGAFFVNGQDQARCFLSTSKGLLESTFKNEDLSGATISLEMPDGTTWPFSYYDETVDHHNFQSEKSLDYEVGKEYTIKASYPGYPDIEATATMAPEVKITSLEWEEEARTDENGNKESSVKITFSDPPNVDNYYLAELSYKLEGIETLISLYPESFEPETSEYNGEILVNGTSIDGEDYELTLYYNSFIGGQGSNDVEIYLTWSSISEDHYRFAKSLGAQQDVDDNPFASPIPLYTNVKNGQGLFSIYNEVLYKVR